MPDERKYTLVVLDTPGIQRYIFSSNRLRENVGASHLVYLASTCWPLKTLCESGWKTNIIKVPKGDTPPQGAIILCANEQESFALNPNQHIEDGNLDAEVIYVGGGNVTLLFRDKETAKEFVHAWSRKVIEEAPGLTPAAVLYPYGWGKSLYKARENAVKALKKTRQSTPPSVPLLGLGVTVEGGSTGKPAVVMSGDYGDPRNRPVSAEVAAKLGRAEEANARLIRTFFNQDAGNAFPCKTACRDPKRNYDYTFPLQTDHFGRTRDERSYLAIVHADGNGVGDFFRRIGEEHAGNARAYIQAVRDASQRLRMASGKALCQVIQLLCKIDVQTYRKEKGIDLVKDEPSPGKPWKPAPGCDPTRQRDCYFLPFRPIVFGGDDFTFISDGRLGLTLAARYLEFFEEAAEEYDLPLKASAGIAIVKVHYPFARAYRLSETLTASAKRYARECVEAKCSEKACSEAEKSLSAMDWHFAPSGLMGSLEEIREREYRVDATRFFSSNEPLKLSFAIIPSKEETKKFIAPTGWLLSNTPSTPNVGWLIMRPVLLRKTPLTWRTWPNFEEAVKGFKKAAKEHRNKVIALRSVLREGAKAVSNFLETTHDFSLPAFEEVFPQAEGKAWDGESVVDCAQDGKVLRSPYFDAIEAMDFYQPLPNSEEEEQEGQSDEA